MDCVNLKTNTSKNCCSNAGNNEFGDLETIENNNDVDIKCLYDEIMEVEANYVCLFIDFPHVEVIFCNYEKKSLLHNNKIDVTKYPTNDFNAKQNHLYNSTCAENLFNVIVNTNVTKDCEIFCRFSSIGKLNTEFLNYEYYNKWKIKRYNFIQRR